MIESAGMTSMTRQWRLIVDAPAAGAWNMALDEAILEAVGKRLVAPTLRLYAWEPACLSLGYAQSVEEVDMARLERNGWHLVRRPTGGQAVLHVDELTYAVIGPFDEPLLEGGVLESYERIAAALMCALRRLGMQPQALPASGTPGALKGPVCFEVPSNYEITVDGKKIIGSAQSRKKWGVLQHGALPLHGDLTRITEALVYPAEEAREAAAQYLLKRAATVETIMDGRHVVWQTAAEAFRAGFEEVHGLTFSQERPSDWEMERARELEADKYGSDAWTRERSSVS